MPKTTTVRHLATGAEVTFIWNDLLQAWEHPDYGAFGVGSFRERFEPLAAAAPPARRAPKAKPKGPAAPLEAFLEDLVGGEAEAPPAPVSAPRPRSRKKA